MKKQRTQYKGTQQRRRQIIEAALSCFNEMGFVDTTMEDIRVRSGASNGSIYHHFKSKDQLAAEVYLEGIIDYQKGMLEELSMQQQAREGIYAIVGYHLRWVSENNEWARYLFTMRHAGFMKETEKPIKEENAKFVKGFGEFFRRHIDQGTLRSLPGELYISLLLGPCQEFARHWLTRPICFDLNLVINEIASAAWNALKTEKGE